ncbi:MAG: membrane protein insertion efficiency factor YidD [Chloroflexi bacterium]|nr:membrane protein insertion efficiency factor YidD [Chloroflexota bacterium]
MKHLLLGLIRLYQKGISPYWPGTCRFEPTCSRYAHEAIRRYGALTGVLLALRRLGRCRPLGGSGYDPVPDLSSVADGTAQSGEQAGHQAQL